MFLKDQAFLLRKTPSGEHHFLMVFFLKEHGLKMALHRRRAKPGRLETDPDLFESGEISIQQKGSDKPAFLQEFLAQTRFPGIARTYPVLKAASRLTRFYEKNLLHMEHFPYAWDLLHTALAALSEKPHPKAVLLKTYFLFAKHEGYPVMEQWLTTLPVRERREVTAILQSPVDACGVDASIVSGYIRSLESFFLQSTDLILPDD